MLLRRHESIDVANRGAACLRDYTASIDIEYLVGLRGTNLRSTKSALARHAKSSNFSNAPSPIAPL